MKRKFLIALAASLALSILPAGVDARPGGGHSMGSRGGRTYMAPPPTRTNPFGAQPMERSLAPAPGGMTAGQPFAARPGYGMAGRHPFLTGFAGGFIGAGLFGLLAGHGLLGGMHGGFGFLGFLLQVLVIGLILSWIIRWFRGSGATRGSGFSVGSAAPLQITPGDYNAFQRLLMDIQAAWSARNLRALSTMATPEMVSYFSEQLADLASRGARNIVSDVQFQQGDLSEAWREGMREYATVAMRYAMIDVTTDMAGQVLDGSSTERVSVTELWTFLRVEGSGNWVLSAIQQAR